MVWTCSFSYRCFLVVWLEGFFNIFCGVYKGKKFEYRREEAIKSDIDTIGFLADEITATSHRLGWSGEINDGVVRAFAGSHPEIYGSGAADNETMNRRSWKTVICL